MDEVTLPITDSDVKMWRTELDEIEPRFEQLRERRNLLIRRIKAATYLMSVRDSEEPTAP
ncbi:MAG: hypothetical protein ACR2RF_26240 [Geminicoccaceae bacterium]